MNKEELFNLRHSSLRNVVERVYGVTKKRFPLLACMSAYPFPTQCDLVQCCCMLHNFIRRNQLDNDMFDHLDDDDYDVDNDDANVANDDDYVEDHANYATAAAWRDDIAQRMWDAYQLELIARNI